MSESKEHFYRDFSKFDEMSTEELNEILRQDSQLPDGEDSDTDAILHPRGVHRLEPGQDDPQPRHQGRPARSDVAIHQPPGDRKSVV